MQVVTHWAYLNHLFLLLLIKKDIFNLHSHFTTRKPNTARWEIPTLASMLTPLIHLHRSRQVGDVHRHTQISVYSW